MRVYVGGLHPNVERAELQREFQKFGSLADVWVARNPPGFAFLEFDDPHDAEVDFLFFFSL
jgi:splicing factor, arginine/serine-rich 7